MTRTPPTANIPAPEEFRDIREFKDACKPDFKWCSDAFVAAGCGIFKSLAHYFQWCWQQPGAETVHAAFMKNQVDV